MNKRRKKKRILHYWELADFPYVAKWKNGLPVFSGYRCPYCGFDSTQYHEDELRQMGGEIKYLNMGLFFDGSYSGREWEEEIKCPICKTKYVISNSDT